MQIFDNPLRYGTITRLLHWGIGALILWQLLGMAIKLVAGRDAELTKLVAGNHSAMGFTIFILVLLRVLWAGVNAGRRPAHGTGLLALAARAGHGALYALMLAVPGIALLRAYGGERGMNVWGIELFAARPEGQAVSWMVELGNTLHGTLGWVLAALIAGHVVMVVIHHRILRDDTLRRMAGK
ncbi:cytochrome b [Paracoccus sp. p4-l81]|uniref:cytochrome b n=1 Tax=Paracoccus sp. p4-l81 TaxID=3342806 RepID=UPI0035B8DF5D